MFLISQVRCADMPAARQTNHCLLFLGSSNQNRQTSSEKTCDILKADEVLERRQLSVLSKLVRVRVDGDAAIHLWCLHCRLFVWHSHGHTEVELRVGLDQIRKLSVAERTFPAG